MSIPLIPVTASSPAEWIRRAGGAVNSLISLLAKLTTRTTDVEARATALEAFTHVPFTVSSITLTPAALPGSPVKGQTVYDIATDKVKTYDGTAWQAHW